MKSAEDIKRYFQKATLSTNPDKHEAIFEKIQNAQNPSIIDLPVSHRFKNRRITMKSAMTKIAAAAAIILTVGFGLFEFIDNGNGSGVVWAEVMAKTEQISAVVFDMTVEIDQTDGENLVLPSRNYVAGDYGTRSDIYIDGKLRIIKYRLPTQKVAYQVRVDRKMYWRYELSEEKAAQGQDPDDPRTWLKMILSDDYTELGRAEINGVTVEGIECNRPEMTGENGIMRLWVDVETNLPVQIVVEMLGMESGQLRQHKYVMENFEWNASLDESIFEPNIPEDYTQGEDPRAGRDRQESSKAQPTSPQTLTEQEKTAQPKVKETVRQFLQACSDGNWDEILKHRPGFAKLSAEQRTSLENQLSRLEIIEIGEPFKTNTSDVWHIPCRIGGKTDTENDEIRVRYDEKLRRFVVCGGP